MKFAHQLRQGAVQEWQRAYVDYRFLKKLIKAAANSAVQESDVVESEEEQPVIAPFPAATWSSDDGEGSRSSPHPFGIEADDTERTRVNSRCTDAFPEQMLDAGTGDPRPSLQPADSSSNDVPNGRGMSSASSGSAGANTSRRRSWLGRAETHRLPKPRWRYPPEKTLDSTVSIMTSAEQRFFAVLDQELQKVNVFYAEREIEAVERCGILKVQLEQLAEHRAEYLEARFTPSNLVHPLVLQGKRVLCGKSEGTEAPRSYSNNANKDVGKARHRAAGLEHREMAVLVVDSDLENGHGSSVNDGRHGQRVQLHMHFRADTYTVARRKLKLATFEAYKLLGYIQNYRLLNRTAFTKATKKMEKLTRIKCKGDYAEKVGNTYFGTSTIIDELQIQMEAMFGSSFEKGSRKEALERLRYMGAAPNHHCATWRAGLLLGSAIAALIAGLVKSSQTDVRARIPYFASLLQIYGAMMLPVLLAIGAGVNLIAWHKAHINVKLIYSFDLRTALDFRQYLEIPALFFCTLSYCLWLSFTVVSPTISPQVWPLVWLFSTIVILFNPLPVFHQSARWWIIRSTARVLTAGVASVEFRDFWLGDQFCSLYYTSLSLGFLVCAYGHHFAPGVGVTCSSRMSWASPVLATLPFLLRLGQSVRRYLDAPETKNHLVNAGKYAASVLYYYFYYNYRIKGSRHDASFSLFIVFGCVNSCYSLTWDVLMDWGLLKRNSRHRLLRDELAYRHRWVYYAAIVVNTLLRFSWVLHFVPDISLRLDGFIIALIETCRRWLWNFIRIESEHVGNVDGYRVTRDVPLPYAIPMEFGRRTSSLDGVFGHEASEEESSRHGAPALNTDRTSSQRDRQSSNVEKRQHSFDVLVPSEIGRRLKAAVLNRQRKN